MDFNRNKALCRPLDYRSLTERTIAHLRLVLKNAYFKPGQQLPSEAELGRQLKVSRTVMRQALSHLKAEGLIFSQQGKGHFVGKPNETVILHFSLPASGTNELQHWFELLASLVQGAAGYAALVRSVMDLASIEAIVQTREDGGIGLPDGKEKLFSFYIALATATHNPYFVDLVKFLHEKLSSAMCEDCMQVTTRDCGPSGIIAEYRAVFNALQASDVKSARDAAWVQVTNTARRWGLLTSAPQRVIGQA